MMNNSKRVLIIGAGALGKQMSHFITNYSNDHVVGWLDDTLSKGDVVVDIPVIGCLNDLESLSLKYDEVLIGIGYKHLAFKITLLYNLKKKNIKLYTYIHPTAYVDKSSKIEQGTFIYPNATIDQNVIISESVIINNATIVSHDSSIGPCTFIAPGVNISGNVIIEDQCFIGTSTTIIDDVKITSKTILGAASLVCDNIKTPGKYVGGPKLIKLKNENTI